MKWSHGRYYRFYRKQKYSQKIASSKARISVIKKLFFSLPKEYQIELLKDTRKAL